MIERLILIAPRFDFEFYEFLKRRSAGDPAVVVIAERRAWQRRKQSSVRIPDRRRADRRQRNTVGLIVAARSATSTAARKAAESDGPHRG
jgi:hypothetical protein